MHGLDTYDYGARQYDPVLCRWDRIDPLCEKYYSVSPYVYCMNNPVMMVDPDGMEVREGTGAYSDSTAVYKDFAKYMANNNDPNSIVIIAHGIAENGSDVATSINIKTYNPKTGKWDDNYISDGKDLSTFLSKNSKTWNNYKKGKVSADDLHIVFYSCRSSSLVRKISEDSDFKDVYFIAPDKDVYPNKNGKVTIVNKGINGRKEYGQWQIFKNGHNPMINGTYGRYEKPGIKGFNYGKAFF